MFVWLVRKVESVFCRVECLRMCARSAPGKSLAGMCWWARCLVANKGARDPAQNALRPSRRGVRCRRLAAHLTVQLTSWHRPSPVSSSTASNVPNAAVLLARSLHRQLLVEAEWRGLLEGADVSCSAAAAGEVAGG